MKYLNRSLFYLYDVIRRGQLGELQRFLANETVDLNVILSCKDVALLHLAVGIDPEEKSVELTEILLKNGADPNICTEEGITPLHIAAIWGRLANLKLLIACGGDPSMKDDDGMSVFDYAAREEQWDVFDYLYNVVDDSTEPMFDDKDNYSLCLNRVVVSTDEIVAEYGTITQSKLKDITQCKKSDMVREWCEKTNMSNCINRLYPTILNATYQLQDESAPWVTGELMKTQDATADESRTTYKSCFSKKACKTDIEISGVNLLSDTHDTFLAPFPPKQYKNKRQTSLLTLDNSDAFTLDQSSRNDGFGTLNEDAVNMQNETNEWISNNSESESSYNRVKAHIVNEIPICLDSDISNLSDNTSQSIVLVNNTPFSINSTNISVDSGNVSECKNDEKSLQNPSESNRHPMNVTYDKENKSLARLSYENQRRSRENSNISQGRLSCKSDDRQSIENQLGSRENSFLSQGHQSRKSNESNVSCGSIVVASVQEDYKYEDKAEDVQLIERRMLVSSFVVPVDTSDAENQSLNNSIASSLPQSIDYDTNTLRLELTRRGFNPGPINDSTKRLYLKKLKNLKKQPINVKSDKKAPYSVELEKTLRNEDWFDDLPNYFKLEEKVRNDFSNPKNNRYLREGHLKTSFTYLLLDPRVSDNLPVKANDLTRHDVWKSFIDSIFYVGKGKRSRPYAHLYQALTLWKRDFRQSQDKKIQRILDIWKSGNGVICLHIFQNIIPAEAFTYEAAMIDVLGAGNLCNAKCGNYYGCCVGWPLKERRYLGVGLLYKALNVFLTEGERQLLPDDI